MIEYHCECGKHAYGSVTRQGIGTVLMCPEHGTLSHDQVVPTCVGECTKEDELILARYGMRQAPAPEVKEVKRKTEYTLYVHRDQDSDPEVYGIYSDPEEASTAGNALLHAKAFSGYEVWESS